jgi:hypothetical protein
MWSTLGEVKHCSYIAAFNAARARVPGALCDEALCYVFLQGCRVDLQRPNIMQSPNVR